MDRLLSQFGEFCFHLVLAAMLIAALPVFYLYMLWDFKRVKQAAIEIEPYNDEPVHGFARCIRLVVNVIIFFSLPLIIIVGLIQNLFFSKKDDDIIW